MRLLVILGTIAIATPALAEPAVQVGTSLQVGDAFGPDAETRVGSNVWVLMPVARGWFLGGEVLGSAEGYWGGYRCGTSSGEGAVPDIAVYCLQPSLGAHVVTGAQANPSPGSMLRLEIGAGATVEWLLAGDEARRRDVRPSGLVRASYAFHVLDTPTLDADWWLGVAVEEHAIGLDDTRLSRSLGLILEGRAR